MVTVTVNIGDFAPISNIPDDVVKRLVNDVTVELKEEVQKNSPKDHGHLQGSYDTLDNGPYSKTIFSGAHYSDYVDKGTGIFGPRGQPIQRVSKNGVTYTVDGITPRHFAQASIETVESKIEDIFIRAIVEVKGS